MTYIINGEDINRLNKTFKSYNTYFRAYVGSL